MLPHARRNRVGRRLFAAVLEAAFVDGKQILQTWTLTGGLGEPFLAASGAGWAQSPS